MNECTAFKIYSCTMIFPISPLQRKTTYAPNTIQSINSNKQKRKRKTEKEESECDDEWNKLELLQREEEE